MFTITKKSFNCKKNQTEGQLPIRNARIANEKTIMVMHRSVIHQNGNYITEIKTF